MEITDEMVERAAKALSAAQSSDDGDGWNDDIEDDEYKRLYRSDARAALEAALGQVR